MIIRPKIRLVAGRALFRLRPQEHHPQLRRSPSLPRLIVLVAHAASKCLALPIRSVIGEEAAPYTTNDNQQQT